VLGYSRRRGSVTREKISVEKRAYMKEYYQRRREKLKAYKREHAGR